jgi:hypothetical protein
MDHHLDNVDLDREQDHHQGLEADLQRMLATTLDRRGSLRWLFAGAGSLSLAGCGGGSSGSDTASSSTSTGTTTTTTTTTTTASLLRGHPGGNRPARIRATAPTAMPAASPMLTTSGIVRSDIRTSVGGARHRAWASR